MRGIKKRRIKELHQFLRQMEKSIRWKLRYDNSQPIGEEEKKKKKARKGKGSKRKYKPKPRHIVLKYLVDKNFHKGNIIKINHKGYIKIKIPEIFSFTCNPDDTLKVIKTIFYYGIQNDVLGLEFDHSDCKVLGIGASTVMDVIVMFIERSNKINRKSFKISGTLPEEEGVVKDILQVSGILKHMGFHIEKKPNIEKFDLISGPHRDALSAYVSSKEEIATSSIVNYYDRCLNTQSYKLNKEGRNNLNRILGEVIGNCEQHSGNDLCKWYTLGHYNLHEKEKYGECHLVIFNLGQTIYEGLKYDCTEETQQLLNQLTKQHIKFFDINKKLQEEVLWTLFALQEGVSRKRDKIEDPDRGTGTIELINSFQTIGDTSDGKHSEMSIISGKAFILFDGKYKLRDRIINGETRKVVAFNDDNDLFKAPDENNVRQLNNHFPGTIISMKFYLERSFIEKKMEGNKSGNKS